MLSLVSANKLDAEVVRKKFSDVSWAFYFYYDYTGLSQVKRLAVIVQKLVSVVSCS